MEREAIAEIGIDDIGRLYVAPQNKKFPYIYREAMEVHWDEDGQYLYAPPAPRAQLATPVGGFDKFSLPHVSKDANCFWNQKPTGVTCPTRSE